MELKVVNGIACVKRDVRNVDVYKTLDLNQISGVPPIIKIDGKTVYYQFINGMTLREYLQVHGKMSGEPLTKFIFRLANILEELKKINVVHKDLKPENIVVSHNDIYLIDFDVSRLSNPKEEDTTLFGTRGYASPEHFGYSSTSFKSDMFSLGRVIEEVDEHFQYRNITSKCTEIDPVNRYNSYKELIMELNKKELKCSSFEENIKEKNYELKAAYSKKMIMIYSIMYIIFFFINFKTVNSFIDLVYNSIACFYIVDIIDYIRVIVKKRKVLKYKLIISGLVINSGIFIVVIANLFK